MVYTSAEVFMIQDSSNEFENTWNFVDRQLARYMWLGQCASEVGTACAGASIYNTVLLPVILITVPFSL